MQTETKSRPTACLPLDHAESRHTCDGEEISENDLHTWIAAQEKREAATQHLFLCTKCALLQEPQGHWQPHDPVTCPLSLTPPPAWSPASGSHRIGTVFCSRQGKAPFCPVWMGGKGRDSSPQLPPAHGAPGWLLFQGLSNGNTRSPASNQASLHSLASLLVFPAKTSPWQGLAVASLSQHQKKLSGRS